MYPAETVGVAREEATHKVTGLLQEEEWDNQDLVDKLDRDSSLVAVAPGDIQEAEHPQAKVGVMAVGKWDTW